jgi:hypothetical protein
MVRPIRIGLVGLGRRRGGPEPRIFQPLRPFLLFGSSPLPVFVRVATTRRLNSSAARWEPANDTTDTANRSILLP